MGINQEWEQSVGTVEQEYEPTTAEEKQDRRNEMKARATLLMALPNKDQLKFHSYQDAKLLMEAIEKRIPKEEWMMPLLQLKSDSLPHAHAQTTKTYYKHRDSRIMKAQELKTKTSTQTLIYKIFLQRYQVYQGRLLVSFQDDAKSNGDALRKCILKGPYTLTTVIVPAVPATENSLVVPEQTTVETVMNMTPENRAYFESEKEAIQ
ncbi:hypothetical protein Tco_1185042 [Tanacetum coccineum]